jgi:DNA recombination protein RmuC
MDIFLYIFLGILAGIVIAGAFYIFSIKKEKPKKEEDQSFLLLQNQLQELDRTINTKLGESTQMIRQHLGENIKIIEKNAQELTKVSEGQKQVIDITKQLESLQDILKNPKQRGVLGEYYLETVLKNVLPPGSFQTQYEFKDGTIVDAVVFIKNMMIPIDSKFSLENYNRILDASEEAERKKLEEAFKKDLKNRIDETAKYIKPEEGTAEFAFMFIPSEAIYYDLLINKIGAVKSNTRDLIQYAVGEKKVMIVSPTTFLAYLQTVLQGLKAFEIEESAKEIVKRVGELMRHLSSYDDRFKKLGVHLGTTINTYNSAYKEFNKIDKDIYRISGKKIGIEPVVIEKPKLEEEDDVDKE